MSKRLVFSIAVGGVVGFALYWTSKNKAEEVKEVKAVETSNEEEMYGPEEVEKVEAPEVEETSRIMRVAKKVWRSIKRYAKKIATWVVDNQQYLEAVGVVFGLATSVNEFRKSVKPVTPISLTTNQVEDVVRTTFDGYLDARGKVMEKDIKEEGIQEFLDLVSKSDTPYRFKNTMTGDRIECKLIEKGVAAA